MIKLQTTKSGIYTLIFTTPRKLIPYRIPIIIDFQYHKVFRCNLEHSARVHAAGVTMKQFCYLDMIKHTFPWANTHNVSGLTCTKSYCLLQVSGRARCYLKINRDSMVVLVGFPQHKIYFVQFRCFDENIAFIFRVIIFFARLFNFGIAGVGRIV